jgi:hypothetical protein
MRQTKELGITAFITVTKITAFSEFGSYNDAKNPA